MSVKQIIIEKYPTAQPGQSAAGSPFRSAFGGRHVSEQIARSGKVESRCNTITFFNTGNVPCSVLLVPVAPGESIAFKGEAMVEDETEYDLVFHPVDPAEVPVPKPLVVVIRKYLHAR